MQEHEVSDLFELEDATRVNISCCHHLHRHVLSILIQLQNLHPHLQLACYFAPPEDMEKSNQSEKQEADHLMQDAPVFSTLLKVYISIIGQLQGVEAQVSAHLSRKVRVLAWMMLRSHSAGFLPGSACLCPYTSMATAPSVRYSIKSSVTVTACSYSTKSIIKVNAC